MMSTTCFPKIRLTKMNSDIEYNIKALLRGNVSDKEFINFINNTTKKKPERKKRWDR